MVGILHMKSSNLFSLLQWKMWYFPSSFTEVCSWINNKPLLDQKMAWCWTDDKPLSESISSTKFTEAFMRHSAPMTDKRFRYIYVSQFHHYWFYIVLNYYKIYSYYLPFRSGHIWSIDCNFHAMAYGNFRCFGQNTWKKTTTLDSVKDRRYLINSLAPGRCGCNFKSVMCKTIIKNNSLGTYCEICLCWIPQNLTIGKSTSVQIMAWCRQATSPGPVMTQIHVAIWRQQPTVCSIVCLFVFCLEIQPNPARNRPTSQNDNWAMSSPTSGVDGDVFSRTVTNVHQYSFYGVDLGTSFRIWGVRVSLLQQG